MLERLNPNNTVIGELQEVGSDQSAQNLRHILGGFLFHGDDIQKPISVLSGGEKARIDLAKLLFQRSNVLLMDEPTNHLDIASREILADALIDYRGTICFVTHDRTVITQIANKIIQIENGKVIIFSGNYDSFLHTKQSHLNTTASNATNKTQMMGPNSKPNPATRRSSKGHYDTPRNNRDRIRRTLQTRVRTLTDIIEQIDDTLLINQKEIAHIMKVKVHLYLQINRLHDLSLIHI